MTPKSLSYAKSNPKVTQLDPQFTPELYEIIKICGENESFLKTDQSDSTILAKWPSSDPKSPTDTQTDPKLTLN